MQRSMDWWTKKAQPFVYHHRKKLGIAISLLYIIRDIFGSGNNCGIILEDAVVAQLAEQLIRNEQVAGSIPVNGSSLF